MEGVIGIAAPVRNHLRKVVAAVGTAFPAFSANDQKVKETIHLIIQTAKEVSIALGYIDAERGRGMIKPKG